MTIRISRVLTEDEHRDLGDQAVKDGFYRNDRRVFTPGMAWFMPWYFDPHRRADDGRHVMIKAPPDDPNKRGFLSPHYWRDWAAIRPPICVVCPNGETWEIDRWSSNGTGWTVTGELPNITCAPSIVVEGYHGFLRDGLFTADLDGRGPTGITRPMPERGA